MAGLLLYYITDRAQFPGDESARGERLLECIAAAAHAGVDYIQLREKDLSARELEHLASATRERLRGTKTKLLVNSRVDVAIASGMDGVHLRADDISAGEARMIFERSGVKSAAVGVSCHTVDELRIARDDGADLVVYGPVFEKDGAVGGGLERLQAACVAAGPHPVFAIGGVTVDNAAECIRAGAAGVAGIRLFQRGDLTRTIAALRRL